MIRDWPLFWPSLNNAIASCCAFVVVISACLAAVEARSTFLPGAVTANGDVDFPRYDASSPDHGLFKRNATRLEVETPSVAYYAAAHVALDPIVVTLVDHFGIPIKRGFPCVVRMTLIDYPSPLAAMAPSSIVAPKVQAVAALAQHATFSDVTLANPAVGVYRLSFRAVGSNATRDDAMGQLTFAILPERIPRRLTFIRRPSAFSNAYAPLTTQPVLRLSDSLGNTVHDAEAQGTVTVTIRHTNGTLLQADQATLVHNVAQVQRGIATFAALQLHVPPALQGVPYVWTFSYRPSDTTPSLVAATPLDDELSTSATVRSSVCNTSALRPVVHAYPNRVYATASGANITVRGGVFQSTMAGFLQCIVDGAGSQAAVVSPATFIDECNINCSVMAPFPSSAVSVRISLDGGVTHATPVEFYAIGVDASLRIRFDDALTDESGVVQLDPLGNTQMGNISVYVADQHGHDMWNYTLQEYTVTLTSPNLPLSGNALVSTTQNGYAQFVNVSLPGFPAVGDYVFYVSGINALTQESLFGSRAVNIAYTREACTPPPIITAMQSSGCKGSASSTILTLCGSGETHALTLRGKYFGLVGAVVYVGSTQCSETKHDAVNVGSQLNCKCVFPNVDSNVTVVTYSTQTYVTPTPSIRMSTPVNVSSVVGCPRNVFPSTGGCLTNTSTRITIYGSNFGSSNASVFLTHVVTNIAIRCTSTTHLVTDPTRVISCSIPVALGVGLVVSVRNAENGQRGYPANYAAVSYAQSSGVLCQTDAEGYFCSQRGTCFLQNGTCNCLTTAAVGYWTGEFCQTCVAGFYGSSCKLACPACSANSVCDDGVDGSGACICNYGWGGTLCNQACPGGSATPCTNHGVCSSLTLACTCYNAPDAGYWSGTTCSTCSEGWSGAACKTPCPRGNNRVCSGHGTCQDGACKCAQNYCDSACNVSFTGCSGCVSGTYGKDCSLTCPGGTDNICFGNGFCGDGPFGNGLCTCSEGWGGENCTITCPHGPSNLCAGHGTCNVETGVCTCFDGYTLLDCATECPGGADVPCNGHGTCSVATAQCTCDFGWSGLDCSVPCPGGVDNPCSLHGTCVQSTSACSCHADAVRGYWAGTTCDACAIDWWGTQCRQQCPFAYGEQCAGHGQCSHAVVCTCFESVSTGFWSGANCGDCAVGYFGSECTAECPGSACNPCYGRGNCSQGVNGTGVCSCDYREDLGFWFGVVCDACAPNWFGDNCSTPCPTGLQNLTCSDRGTCSDGRAGTGACTCSDTFGGPVCADCAFGFYGPNCAFRCPGLIGSPCLLRGTCENTETSDGTCACDAGYGGTMCQYVCPTGPYGVCNAQGTCVLNAAGTEMVCVNCTSSATTGYWTGASCSECLPGYYGSLCKLACPGGASSPCNNRGTCKQGYTGNGECTCSFGYAGLSCEKTCVGGALVPCSGHGTCDGVTGECECYSTASDGFWVGSSCDTCNAAYASSSCTVACPTAVPGSPCSGRGACYQGVCLSCNSGFCGATCATTVGCVNCPSGTYGPSCTDCPGGRATPCTNQGVCLQGPNGNGNCICYIGYRGANCSVQCPGPTGAPCYGRGVCSDDGQCTCTSNWAGSDCNTPCNGFDQRLANSTSCSGVGVCNKADGSCACNYGYGGSDCQIQCPGTAGPCNNHGRCLAADGTCACYTNASIGFWNGPSCDYCQPGYYGATTCSKQCFQGVSDATFTQCVCFEHWSGAGCDIPCPGLLDGSVCYGHGTCAWGRDALGLCSCDADWFDPNCLTYCTKAGCDAILINGQCNAGTGICECQFDALGHWDYTTDAKASCEVCQVYYFGERCESPCACSRHGTCDRRTGACTCYSDQTRGHWGGTSCSQCATGYIGVQCQNLNVAISPLGTVAAVATVPALDVRLGIICRDPLHPFTYVGTSPVMVLTSTDATVSTLYLGGFAISCVYRSTRELYIVTFADARLRLNVINRQTGEYLRTEYVPLPAAVVSSVSAIMSSASTQRHLMQFEPTNASTLNGAVMDASTILLPFVGASEDIVVVPYGIGVIQYYRISSGLQVSMTTEFTEIVDASPVEGLDNIYSIAAIDGNATHSHWEIALVSNEMPGSSGALSTPTTRFYDRYGAHVAAVCPSCEPLRVFGSGTSVILIFASAGVGMYLTRMDIERTPPPYNASTPLAANNSYFTMQYFYGSVCDVTATAVDTYGGTGFFAMSCGSDPSVILKFELETCLVTGIIQLSRVGTDAVTVVRMAVDDARRTLEALTPLSRSQRLQKVSLYAVSALTPLLADTKGGTRITVTGEGFVDGMLCTFGSASASGAVATFVSKHSLVCIAPPGGTVSCQGEAVEVSLPAAGPTNNLQLLQRVASASIRDVINEETDEALGFLHGGRVTVLGSGFVLPSNASLLLCRLYTPTDDGASAVVVVATFVSSYEVECNVPSMSTPLAKPSYLEVSIDGTVFSDSNVAYDVTGDASSLFIESPVSGALTVRAARQANLPSIFVTIADSAEHPLGKYTNGTYTIHASLPAASTFLLMGTVEVTTVDGLAEFANLSIVHPAVGAIQLLFQDAHNPSWQATLAFSVVEGEPYQMYFARLPSASVTNDNPTLSEQPIVGVKDASGNALDSLEEKTIAISTIQLSYWYHDLSDDVVHRVVAVPQLNAKFRVEGVAITGKHQQAYYLTFTAPELEEPTLVSGPITVGWCSTDAFAIANSTACQPCPQNAVCDGTARIRAQDGWWRADDTTLQFYSCGAPYSGDSCVNDSACKSGYYGPRCSLCDKGYGRSGRFCVECQSSDTNSGIVLLACVALLFAITMMVYSIVMTSSNDLLPVLFRNLVTYVQILARLSDTHMPWPDALDRLWRMLSSVANLQAIDFSPFDCAMDVDFFQKYVYTLLIPWLMIVLVAPLAIVVVRIYAREERDTVEALKLAATCREEEDATLLKEISQATAQRRATMIGEASRRRVPSNPLEGPSVLPQSQGLDSVLQDGILKAVAEDEAMQRRNDDWSSEALTKNRIDHVAHILSIRRARYAPGAVIVVTAVTIFTLLYPTLVQSSGQVLQCESMDLGEEGIALISSNQRDVRCTSSYYRTFETLSISMIMVYGVSIPLGLIAVVLLLRRFGGMSLARAVLAFTMAGLKPELWFWESVNMGRKFMAMIVVVFVMDAKLQMIVFMWVMVIGFVLNVTFSPYTSRLVYLLECLGMAATVATMNLVLMFFFFLHDDGSTSYNQWGAIAISVAIIVVNAVAGLCYVYAIGKHIVIRFDRWRSSAEQAEALQEAVHQRIESMSGVMGEVRSLRLRRGELDQAIQQIEDHIVEEDAMSPSPRHEALSNWQFPTDENPFQDEDDEEEDASVVLEASIETMPFDDGGATNMLCSRGSKQPDEPSVFDGSPAEEGAALANRKATMVTFASEKEADGATKPRQRTSMIKRAPSTRAAFKDFTIGGQREVVRRAAAGNLGLWMQEGYPEADRGTVDAQRAAPSAALFDTRELLAALGEEDEEDHLDGPTGRQPQTQTAAVTAAPPMLGRPLFGDAVRREGDSAGALSVDMLRRMQRDDDRRVPSPTPYVGLDGADSSGWQRLDPQMLLDSDSESGEGDAVLRSSSKRIVPVSKQAMVERVQNWQHAIANEPELESPSTSHIMVHFDHHYRRDEEAEVEFLEGRRDEPPPSIRSIFLKPTAASSFSVQHEMQQLDQRIAQEFDFSSTKQPDDEAFELVLEDTPRPVRHDDPTSPLFALSPSTKKTPVSLAWCDGAGGPTRHRPEAPGDPSDTAGVDEDTNPLPTMAVRVLQRIEAPPAAAKKPADQPRDAAAAMDATAKGVGSGPGAAPTARGSTQRKPLNTLMLLGADSDDEDGDDDAYTFGVAPHPILQPLGPPVGARYDALHDMPAAPMEIGSPHGPGAYDYTGLGPDFLEAISSPSVEPPLPPQKPSTISLLLQRTLSNRVQTMRNQHHVPSPLVAPPTAPATAATAAPPRSDATGDRRHSDDAPLIHFQTGTELAASGSYRVGDDGPPLTNASTADVGGRSQAQQSASTPRRSGTGGRSQVVTFDEGPASHSQSRSGGADSAPPDEASGQHSGATSRSSTPASTPGGGGGVDGVLGIGAPSASLHLATHPVLDIASSSMRNNLSLVSPTATDDIEAMMGRIFDAHANEASISSTDEALTDDGPPGRLALAGTAVFTPGDRERGGDASTGDANEEGGDVDDAFHLLASDATDDEFVQRTGSTVYECNVPVATGLPTASEMFFPSATGREGRTAAQQPQPRRLFGRQPKEQPVPAAPRHKGTPVPLPPFDTTAFFKDLDVSMDQRVGEDDDALAAMLRQLDAPLPTTKAVLPSATPPRQRLVTASRDETPPMPPQAPLSKRSPQPTGDVKKQRLNSVEAVNHFLDHMSDDDAEAEPASASGAAQPEEPWYARRPLPQTAAGSGPSHMVPPSPTSFEPSTERRPQRRRSVGFGKFHRQPSTVRSSGGNVREAEATAHRPLSPLVVEWEDDD